MVATCQNWLVKNTIVNLFYDMHDFVILNEIVSTPKTLAVYLIGCLLDPEQ